ncbi:MAG: sigma-54 dependent transcriptional regulator, partial [candidate division NC10 bacterium]
KEGIEVLRELQELPEQPQVIVMTGFQEVSTAVEAMKLGAYDYLTKPTKIEELAIVIRKAAEKAQLLRDNEALRAHAPGAEPFGGIVTRSPEMQEVLRIVERVAPTDSAVLILGESGTGKELVARAIHECSARAQRPFVAIHCGALPREVFESELYGHEKGAFTGAVSAKPGLVELADGGTLFLDEIGEMEPDSQVKLLRALETGTFFRVGGTRPRRVDVRLVVATNRDLAEAMKTGEFRQDLYYRINTIALKLPPLRQRREDIALLANHFVTANARYGVKRLHPWTVATLEAYDWPGNVRELRAAVERIVLLGDPSVWREITDDAPVTPAPREEARFVDGM